MSLRIGFDAWGLSGPLLYTGMGQYARHLVDGIARSGADAEIVAYGSPDERRPAWLPASVAWRASTAPGPAKTAALLSRTLMMRRAVANDGLDVFHGPALHVRPSLPPVPAVGCPLAVTVHDVIPLTAYSTQLPWRLRAFYRWNLRRALRADAVVTVSEAARAQIVELTGAVPARVCAIPNGVDFASNSDRAPLARLGVQLPYLLYAGSYEPRKNLRRALSVYARLAADGVEQHFVAVVEAASGYAAAAHAHAQDLGLGGRVHFLHTLPEDDLRALYTHADLLFFPSLAEGFGFPPLQAAACGIPVVASDIAAVRETMADAAFYADPRDEASMVDAIRRVLSDGGLRSRMSSAGRVRASAYTWERSVAAHLDLYRRMAAAHAPH